MKDYASEELIQLKNAKFNNEEIINKLADKYNQAMSMIEKLLELQMGQEVKLTQALVV